MPIIEQKNKQYTLKQYHKFPTVNLINGLIHEDKLI